MDKPDRKQLEARVLDQMPGYEVLPASPTVPAADSAREVVARAEASLPETSTLQSRWRKYAEMDPPRAASAAPDRGPASPPGIHIFQVRPQASSTSADPRRAGPGPKIVITDDDGGIIGAQG